MSHALMHHTSSSFSLVDKAVENTSLVGRARETATAESLYPPLESQTGLPLGLVGLGWLHLHLPGSVLASVPKVDV